MKAELKAAFDAELNAARAALMRNELDIAFHHLERAHILGQRHTLAHVVSRAWMLRVGLRRLDAREILGQFTRIFAAALFSRIWIPVGNTGGANVNPFQPIPVPEDLRPLLRS